MKKYLVIILAGIIAFGSCKKKDDTPTPTPTPTATPISYEKKNKSFIMYTHSPSEPTCGILTYPSFDSILHYEGIKITGVLICKSQTQTSLNNTVTDDVYSDFGLGTVNSHQLALIINDSMVQPNGGWYSTIGDNYTWGNHLISKFQQQAVVAAINLTKSISATSYNVTANVKFYTASSGKDYHLALYLVEDNVTSTQSKAGKSTLSLNCVLRDAFQSDYKGSPINNSADITANQEFRNITWSCDLDPGWNTDNLKVVGVIWDVTAKGAPIFVNSNLLK